MRLPRPLDLLLCRIGCHAWPRPARVGALVICRTCRRNGEAVAADVRFVIKALRR